ncbi:MAG: site-2 protease family protein [bacterium]|nr:site-2 protease family protein [bacterium]
MLLFANNFEPSFLLGAFLGVLIGMTVHEFAHNYVAHLMGDPYPQRSGRLTLNPMVHIYWPGFIMFLIIGFGILGTAPIAAQRMRNPRWGYLAAVAAGPFSNLLLAIVLGIVFRILFGMNSSQFLIELLYYMIVFNVLQFVFNLLPMFPLDGWHITLALLPPEQAYWWKRQAQNSQFVFFALILISFILPPGSPLNILSLILTRPLYAIVGAIIGLPVGI